MHSRTRSGMSMIYLCVGMVIFIGFASFGVDYGRVQMAKTELRRAADAAALAGATQLGATSTVRDLCAQYAAANNCDGTSVVIDKTNDIEFGDWNKYTNTFTALTGSAVDNATAVRVWCRRTTARGNPLTLFFGRALGARTCDVTVFATAAVVPPGFSLVGLDFISMKGNASASYWSSTGDYTGNSGNIASNGNITSSGSSTVTGTIWKTSGATVSGISANSVKTLPTALSYPNPTLPSPYSYTNNDNGNITGQGGFNATYDFGVGNNKVVHFPGGVYVAHNFNVNAGGVVYFDGPSTVYFSGTFNMQGSAVTTGNTAKNLTLVGVTINGSGPGTINIGSSTTLYATINAPQSPITLSGDGAIYGSILGKSITMTGNSSVYYDLSIPGSTSSSTVKLVQ